MYSCKVCEKIQNGESKKAYREMNKERASQYGKKYRQDNKVELAEKSKEYRKNNAIKLSEYYKNYYQENKVDIQRYSKEYREINSDKLKHQKREYYLNNREHMYTKSRQWVYDNPEKAASYKRNWRAKNPDADKIYYENNKEKVLSLNSIYRQTHPKEMQAYKRKWKVKNREKLYQSNRDRDLHKQSGDYSMIDWENTQDYFEHRCAYCHRESINMTQDHFIPLSKGGSYSVNNIIPACNTCNSSKHNKAFETWYITKDFYNEQRANRITEYLNNKQISAEMATTKPNGDY